MRRPKLMLQSPMISDSVIFPDLLTLTKAFDCLRRPGEANKCTLHPKSCLRVRVQTHFSILLEGINYVGGFCPIGEDVSIPSRLWSGLGCVPARLSAQSGFFEPTHRSRHLGHSL